MKVRLRYEQGYRERADDDAHETPRDLPIPRTHTPPNHTIDITLPTSWLDKPITKLIDTFVHAYNKKHTNSTPMRADQMALQVDDDSPFTHTKTKGDLGCQDFALRTKQASYFQY